ncbi:hypothetical protein HDU76_002522 [Blyttiomyces sp. JEL0837]|nr:hypothetical protein HDU76_002522 [Blyttiomyces sp. JEL0837]
MTIDNTTLRRRHIRAPLEPSATAAATFGMFTPTKIDLIKPHSCGPNRANRFNWSNTGYKIVKFFGSVISTVQKQLNTKPPSKPVKPYIDNGPELEMETQQGIDRGRRLPDDLAEMLFDDDSEDGFSSEEEADDQYLEGSAAFWKAAPTRKDSGVYFGAKGRSVILGSIEFDQWERI